MRPVRCATRILQRQLHKGPTRRRPQLVIMQSHPQVVLRIARCRFALCPVHAVVPSDSHAGLPGIAGSKSEEGVSYG